MLSDDWPSSSDSVETFLLMHQFIANGDPIHTETGIALTPGSFGSIAADWTQSADEFAVHLTVAETRPTNRHELHDAFLHTERDLTSLHGDPSLSYGSAGASTATWELPDTTLDVAEFWNGPLLGLVMLSITSRLRVAAAS